MGSANDVLEKERGEKLRIGGDSEIRAESTRIILKTVNLQRNFYPRTAIIYVFSWNLLFLQS